MAPMSKDDRSVLGWGAFGVAIAALGLALFGLSDDGGSSGGESAASAEVSTIQVDLGDFYIDPNMITADAGQVQMVVTNSSASTVHNLSIPDLGAKTPDLQPGESYTLDLGDVAAGEYSMLCEIPGHAAAGMTGMLMVGGTGGETAGGGSSGMTDHTDWQEMDRIMQEAALAFPAVTEGKGGELMEPTRIAADGTKEYDVVATEVDWEVSPGKFVKAMAYNGVVPGPEIHLEVGDKFRMNFTNEMSESTNIHWHGIRVPNEMDGVDPYTQAPVPPGGTFVYEFTALEPAVGIYHSHHDAQVQVPNGLFGAFTIGEMPIPDYLKERGITKVDKTVNMVLNDAGTIGLSLNGKSFPATEPYTLRKGQVMVVNYLNEGLTSHPMHLHQPVGWIIAKDGIPLETPFPGDTINVAPGERYTVLYEAKDTGVWAWHCHILTHAEGPQGMFGMVTALIVEE
jgi:FtsP/CotA-like multicopper oxidase with cupredoxin domain